MSIHIGNDKCIYLVFRDSYRAWDYYDGNEALCLFIACFGQYENAICVQDLWGM